MQKTKVKYIRAGDIVDLLGKRHQKDIFVPECKSGSTWSSKYMVRMDVWAMKKSYRHPCIWGYEIKVNRHDFLKDEKWIHYLPMCNQFYFVCPSHLIGVNECPREVGLMWVSSTGNMVYIKKKAPRRKIDDPVEVYKYILMSRAYIGRESRADDITSVEYWTDWLKNKEAKLELGTQCSMALRESYRQQVYEVQSQMRVMESRMEKYKKLLEMCEKLGIHPDGWQAHVSLQDAVDRARKGLPEGFLNKLKSLRSGLDNSIEYFEKL